MAAFLGWVKTKEVAGYCSSTCHTWVAHPA